MTKTFLIRIEGVNLGATVYDTHDLSTIRGASLAYLRHSERWPERLEARLAAVGTSKPAIQTIVVGASDGIYHLQLSEDWELQHARVRVGEAIAAAIAAARKVDDDLERTLPFLTFTWAVIEEGEAYAADVAELIALCRQMQLQQLTVDVPPEPAAGNQQVCPYDHTRPADTDHNDQEGATILVSAATNARRTYGRRARQKFYDDELGKVLDHAFADEFSDLVGTTLQDGKDDPGLKDLPPALTGKHAVVYLDGNSFTKIRENVIFKPVGTANEVQSRQTDFSNHVRTARHHLLGTLLDRLSSDPRMRFKASRRQLKWDPRETRLKFETLLWGGDEAMFVLPAWKLMDVLPVLAEALDNEIWRLPCRLDRSGIKLTHAVGIVMCNIKTPIAVSRNLANDVADASKKLAKKSGNKELPLTELRNVYSFQILESVEPPRANLDAFRRQLYGTNDAVAFTLVGKSGVDEFLKVARALQNPEGGLPRSQLYKLLQEARAKGLIGDGARTASPHAGNDFMEREAAEACKRSGCTHYQLLGSPALGFTSATPLMPLMRLAELWDYLDPLDEDAQAAGETQAGAAA